MQPKVAIDEPVHAPRRRPTARNDRRRIGSLPHRRTQVALGSVVLVGMKILIVDDSRAMRMIVRRTLRQAGYGSCTLAEAANGREGLEAVIADEPDLVLSDWNMPEMSGLEFLEQLNEKGSCVPFGFVTSEGTTEMRARAADAGALFLIAKPFTPESFKSALEPLLG